MSFIDRLKADIDIQRVAREKQESQRILQALEEEQVARRLREYHELQRNQAHSFYGDSGLDSMLKELALVVGGEVADEPFYRSDRDNKLVQVRWQIVKIGSKSYRGTYDEDGRKWDEFSAKGFDIECNPRGVIYFKGGWFSSSRIPEGKWKNNSSVFDKALQRAYKHPKKITYVGNIRYTGPLLRGE